MIIEIIMNKEELVLVVSTTNISTALLEPLQLILPTLRMAAPFSLYTSAGNKISSLDLYSSLAQNLSTPSYCSISLTLRTILNERRLNNFRVCILGGKQINWDIVLEYKRRKILIDTAGLNDILSQVSHTTGGISKIVSSHNIIKLFLTDFSMSSTTRRYYLLQQNSIVKFHLQPKCCNQHSLSGQFYACSVCMNIYCPQHSQQTKICYKCGSQFDPKVIVKDQSNLQIPLRLETLQQKQQRIDIN